MRSMVGIIFVATRSLLYMSAVPMLQRRPLGFVANVYSTLTMVLMVPVSVTVFVVVWSVKELTPLDAARNESPAVLASDERSASSPEEKAGASILNAIIIVAMVTVITLLMVLLYKLRCMKVIITWFVISAAMIFFFLFWVWADLFCTRFQIPYELVGMALLLWNFGVVGIIAIFYYAHPKFMQSYLVVLSIIMAWFLTRLPEWSTWAILLAIAIYDIVAVMMPKGPLQMLVREAQERNEPIPGFVYDSGQGAGIRASTPQQRDAPVANPITQPAQPWNETDSRTANGEMASEAAPTVAAPATAPTTAPAAAAAGGTAPAAAPGAAAAAAAPEQMEEEEEEEEPDPFEAAEYAQPFKLGLGDFIFYSLLVGRASQFSYVSWMTCYVCVVMGLVGTLTCLLFLRGKVPALPALPISIFSATAAYFVTRYSTVPYNYYLSVSGLMV